MIVLTGAGRAFSAGGDIPWMQTAIDRPESFEQTAREAKRIVFSMLDLEKPLIARVNGHATGLGATLALFCDVIFAADTARIGDPHVSIGFVAGDGGPAIWPQLIGYARAKEYLMTASCCPPAGGGDRPHQPRRPARGARRGGGRLHGQAARRRHQGDPLEQDRDQHRAEADRPRRHGRERRLRGAVEPHEDHQEAVNAFRARRKPVFTAAEGRGPSARTWAGPPDQSRAARSAARPQGSISRSASSIA